VKFVRNLNAYRVAVRLTLVLMVLLAVLLSAVAGWSPARSVLAQTADSRELALFTPVRGVLNDDTPIEQYTFEAFAHQVISVIVVTVEGDLDPVVQIIGPDGTTTAENDDIDSLVRDAGLEAFELPLAGTYTVRVMRYRGVNGTTTGQYEMTLTPGFADLQWHDRFDDEAAAWLTPEGEQVPLSSDGLRMRVSEPGTALRAFRADTETYESLYVRADVELFGVAPYSEFGFVLRAQGEDFVQSYVFKINTDGQWSVSLNDETGEFVLRSWSNNAALDTETWQIAVLARGDRFEIFANDTLLGTVTDGRLRTAGAVGLYAAMPAGQDDDVNVIFNDVLVTTRLGTTYAGLPLSLNSWSSLDPNIVVGELTVNSVINPADNYDLFLTDKRLEATDPDALFELIGTDAAIYDNFVLSTWLKISSEGDSAGCGLVYRWQDERNLDLAYVDLAGGFGVVQARDGELTKNVYDFSPMVGVDVTQLLVLVRGSDVALYINGALVAEERVEAGEGRVGVALLNYEDAASICTWSDIWVWELADSAP